MHLLSQLTSKFHERKYYIWQNSRLGDRWWNSMQRILKICQKSTKLIRQQDVHTLPIHHVSPRYTLSLISGRRSDRKRKIRLDTGKSPIPIYFFTLHCTVVWKDVGINKALYTTFTFISFLHTFLPAIPTSLYHLMFYIYIDHVM